MKRAFQMAKVLLVLARLFWVALLLNRQVCTLVVAEDKGKVKKEVKEIQSKCPAPRVGRT